MPKFDDLSGRDRIGWRKFVAAHPWGKDAEWKTDVHLPEDQPKGEKSPFHNRRVKIGDKEHTNTESLTSRFANKTFIPTPDHPDFDRTLRTKNKPPRDT